MEDPQEDDPGGSAGREERPKRVSFEHSKVVSTSKESQQRLFRSRHRQARKERHQERRQEALRTFVYPVVGVVVFVAVISWSLTKMYQNEKAARAKLKEVVEEQATVITAADDVGGEVLGENESEIEKARERYLRGTFQTGQADELSE